MCLWDDNFHIYSKDFIFGLTKSPTARNSCVFHSNLGLNLWARLISHTLLRTSCFLWVLRVCDSTCVVYDSISFPMDYKDLTLLYGNNFSYFFIIVQKQWFRIRSEIAYYCKTENWKHYYKIIFKCVNSALKPIFNENFAEKRGLWIP